jgi:hypothetical protein
MKGSQTDSNPRLGIALSSGSGAASGTVQTTRSMRVVIMLRPWLDADPLPATSTCVENAPCGGDPYDTLLPCLLPGDSVSELPRFAPVTSEGVREPGSPGNHRSRCPHAPTKVAEPPFRLLLIRFAGIVREPARDLEEGELSGRGLLRVIAFVRAAERDPRLEVRPRRGRVQSGPSRARVSARARKRDP